MDIRQEFTRDELIERARIATATVLRNYTIPSSIREKLEIGVSYEDDCIIFELFILGLNPDDAHVFTQTRVNKTTGEVERVRLFNVEGKRYVDF